ncbi:MAG: SusF/SusE family outer membrane protein [Firmicutes bacterium]|nr:SusF/SusE family outer membrane protein [Bacillota bacterium]
MKKVFVSLLAVILVLSMAACAPKPLKDEGHAAWVAHGQYKLADGTENNWNGKDSTLYEKSALTPIALNDVKAISQEVYDVLSKKEVKYLYKIDLIFGTNDAGWTTNCMIDGKLHRANGSYAFKIAACTVDADGDNKVYAEDQWIHDPKTANAESLTPATLFEPVWQEEADENGFSWASNPVVIGGPGLYTLVIAQYKNTSAPNQPGYGIALVLKEKKEGIAYEEVVEYVPADHTYGIVGSFAASNWGSGADVAMTAAGDNVWTGEVELKAGEEFKVRADSDWTYSWGNGEENFKCEKDGTYVVTITFTGSEGAVEVTAK